MTTITAESPALIAEIHVAVGDEIASGGILVSTELMKMRHDIRAATKCGGRHPAADNLAQRCQIRRDIEN